MPNECVPTWIPIAREEGGDITPQKKLPVRICLAAACSCSMCCCLAIGLFILFPLLTSSGYLLGGGDSDYNDEDHPYVTADGWNTIKVEPHIMTRGFPYEQFYIIEDWGIAKDWKSNGTHVYVPYDNGTNPVQAKYIKDVHATGDYEIGVSIQTMSYNMFGAISPTIKLGTAEKLHVFKTGKPMDTTALDHARADSEAQSGLAKWIARTFSVHRKYLMCLFYMVNMVGLQMREIGCMNEHQLQPVRAFGKHEKITGNVAEQARASAKETHEITGNVSSMRKKLTDFFDGAKASGMNFSEPLASSVTCMHWDDDGITNYTAAGMWVPLDTKFTVYRGHVLTSPFLAWEVMAGVTVWHHNNHTGKYEIHVGISVMNHWSENPSDSVKPGVFIGPPDGGSMKVVSPARKEVRAPSLLLHAFYRITKLIPADYGFFDEDPEVLCPEPLYDKLHAHISNTNFQKYTISEHNTHPPPTLNEKLELLSLVMDVSKCTTNFLKPLQTASTGFGLFTVSQAIHGLLEIPPAVVMPVVGGRFWMKIETSVI